MRKIFFILLIFTLFPVSVLASSQTVSNRYKIDPVFPSNQLDGAKGFFDLNVQPNEKENLTLRVTNYKNTTLRLSLEGVNALTTQNGAIEYSSSPFKNRLLDPNFALSKMINIQSELTIPANGSKELTFSVTAPNSQTGTYLGGILFRDEDQGEKEPSNAKKSMFTINSQIAYAVAIQLNLPHLATPSVKVTKANLVLTPSGVQVGIQFVNPTTAIVTDLNGSFTVLKKDGTKLFSQNFGSFKMAPETQFEYPVFWGSKTISPGDYIVSVTTTLNGVSQHVDFPITIKSQQIKQISQPAAYPHPTVSNQNSIIVILVAVVVLLSFAIIFLLLKMKKKK